MNAIFLYVLIIIAFPLDPSQKPRYIAYPTLSPSFEECAEAREQTVKAITDDILNGELSSIYMVKGVCKKVNLSE